MTYLKFDDAILSISWKTKARFCHIFRIQNENVLIN